MLIKRVYTKDALIIILDCKTWPIWTT